MAAGRDLGDTLVTGRGEAFEQRVHLVCLTTPQRKYIRIESAGSWRNLVETGARCDDQVRARLAGEQRK